LLGHKISRTAKNDSLFEADPAEYKPMQYTWHDPPPDLTLPRNEVHVWRVWLNLPEARVAVLRKTLDEDELQRANRFRFPQHRRHFTVARGVLRMLLGRYLHRSPAEIAFEYNRYGKPFLKGGKSVPCAEESPDCIKTDRDNGMMEFNLSHSGEMALYAFSPDRKVGIDVEWTGRRIADREGIVKRFFSPREAEVLSGLPVHREKEAFFGCWTRKEAYIKARGKGLSIPLDGFEIIPLSLGAADSSIRHEGEGNTENQDDPELRVYCPMDRNDAPRHDSYRNTRKERFHQRHAQLLPSLYGLSTLTTCDDSQPATWGIRTFISGSDYIATLVVEGAGWKMSGWQWR